MQIDPLMMDTLHWALRRGAKWEIVRGLSPGAAFAAVDEVEVGVDVVDDGHWFEAEFWSGGSGDEEGGGVDGASTTAGSRTAAGRLGWLSWRGWASQGRGMLDSH